MPLSPWKETMSGICRFPTPTSVFIQFCRNIYTSLYLLKRCFQRDTATSGNLHRNIQMTSMNKPHYVNKLEIEGLQGIKKELNGWLPWLEAYYYYLQTNIRNIQKDPPQFAGIEAEFQILRNHFIPFGIFRPLELSSFAHGLGFVSLLA